MTALEDREPTNMSKEEKLELRVGRVGDRSPPGKNGRPMVMPRDIKGKGTECAIIKWLKIMGILASVLALMAHFL